MGKGKLSKFAENETFRCLRQPSNDDVLHADDPIKGHWNEEMFTRTLGGRPADIVVELGCGKGEYTIDLSSRRPGCNYIGVDIKGARLWRGAKTATQLHLTNVAFLRTRIEFINSIFAPGEISQIWITFCDPQPKSPNRRLTCPAFLERYRGFLSPGGIVHLKTDSAELHSYTLDVLREQGLEILASTSDLYASELSQRPPEDVRGTMPELLDAPELREVRTHYENIFLSQGKPITYLAFKLNN